MSRASTSCSRQRKTWMAGTSPAMTKAIPQKRKAARSYRAALCVVGLCRWERIARSEHQAFLDQHPAAVLDLLDLGDRVGKMVGLGELGRRRVEDVHEL